MPYSLFKSKQSQPCQCSEFHSLCDMKIVFFKAVLNFLPFNFVKCLPVLVLWNWEKRRLWVTLLITRGWKPDPALTGRWQICLFGFRSRQGETAGNRPCVADGSSLEGHGGAVRSPAALLCSALRDAAQAAWGLELGWEVGREHVCRLCAVGPAPRREVQHRPGAEGLDPWRSHSKLKAFWESKLFKFHLLLPVPS